MFVLEFQLVKDIDINTDHLHLFVSIDYIEVNHKEAVQSKDLHVIYSLP